MGIDWSAWDGALGLVLVIALIWAGLKVAKRLIVGVVIVVIIAVVFFGLHWQDILRSAEDMGLTR